MANTERRRERSAAVIENLLNGTDEAQTRMIGSLSLAALSSLFSGRLPRILAAALGVSAVVSGISVKERRRAAADLTSHPLGIGEPFLAEQSGINENVINREIRLQSSREFITDLISHVRNAKKRVWLQFMKFESGEITSVLVDELSEARERGVDTAIHLDRYSRNFIRVGNRDVWKYSQILRNPIEPKSGLDERTLKQRNRYMTEYDLRRLEKIGILSYSLADGFAKRLMPFGDGDHKKLAIVDDTAWLGTMNLTDSDVLGMNNFMLRFTSPELVDILGNIFLHPPTDDASYLSSHAQETGNIDWELLVDAGQPHRSIIYKRALAMLSRATNRIEYTTQYWPTGLLKEALIARARQGLDVTVSMQSLGDHRIWRYPYILGFANFFMKESKSSGLQLVFPSRPTHTKGLVIDGQAALFGSHDLFEPTLRVGVRELSLYTEDPYFVHELEKGLFNNTKGVF